MFFRNENPQQFLRYYPAVSTIIIINTILFLAMLSPSLRQLIYGLGVGSNFHVAQGQYWRIVTPIFLHGGFSHFVFNSFSLVIFAPALELMLGKWRFLGLYFFSGILGNLATFFLGGLAYNYHLGASGAVYGLLGFYLALITWRPHVIDPHSSQIIKTMLIFGAIYTVIVPNINIYAHLFGFLAGMMMGHFILQKPSRSSR